MPDQSQQPPNAKKEQIADLEFPIYGLDLSQEVELQRPDTTPIGVNVRGWEAQTNRNRGGSRNGLSKYIPTQLDPPVGNMLVQDLNIVVTVQATALLTTFGLDLSNTGGAIPSPANPLFFVPLYGSGIQLNKNVGATGNPAQNWYGGVTTAQGSGPTYQVEFEVGNHQTATMLGGTGTLPSGTGLIAVGQGLKFYFQVGTFAS